MDAEGSGCTPGNYFWDFRRLVARFFGGPDPKAAQRIFPFTRLRRTHTFPLFAGFFGGMVQHPTLLTFEHLHKWESNSTSDGKQQRLFDDPRAVLVLAREPTFDELVITREESTVGEVL